MPGSSIKETFSRQRWWAGGQCGHASAREWDLVGGGRAAQCLARLEPNPSTTAAWSVEHARAATHNTEDGERRRWRAVGPWRRAAGRQQHQPGGAGERPAGGGCFAAGAKWCASHLVFGPRRCSVGTLLPALGSLCTCLDLPLCCYGQGCAYGMPHYCGRRALTHPPNHPVPVSRIQVIQPARLLHHA